MVLVLSQAFHRQHLVLLALALALALAPACLACTPALTKPLADLGWMGATVEFNAGGGLLPCPPPFYCGTVAAAMPVVTDNGNVNFGLNVPFGRRKK